jgi:large conductance mechanosensitive channel
VNTPNETPKTGQPSSDSAGVGDTLRREGGRVKGVANDFRKFLLRGNVIDLAVAVIVGAAFNTVVQSLVKNIFTPFIGWIFGKPNFSDLTVSLGGCDSKTHACKGTIMYGSFLTDVVNFVIIGFSVFVIVKTFEKLQRMRRGPIEEDVDPLTVDQELLTEIRDLLRAQVQPAEK